MKLSKLYLVELAGIKETDSVKGATVIDWQHCVIMVLDLVKLIKLIKLIVRFPSTAGTLPF